MFVNKSNVFFHKNAIFRRNLITISSVSMLVFSGVSLVQAQTNSSLATLTQPSITHTLFGVSVTPVSDQQVSAKEGDLLNIGDIVRTGEDSIARIYFPDGTTQTLCENTSYQVEESGSEIYAEDNDPNSRANIIAAFSQCDIRPRFINRCRTEGGFISRLPKAGERGRIGQNNQDVNGQNSGNYVVKERSGDHLVELTDALNENENGKFKRSDFSSRCSRGEELFANFVSISDPEPEIQQITVPVQNSVVPAPPEEAVTVPETGSSPL